MTRLSKLTKVVAVTGLVALMGVAVAGAVFADGSWRPRGGYGCADPAGYGMMKGQHGRGGAHGIRMFEQLDADKDGRVTEAEVEKARQDRLAKFDANGDGKLALGEFEKLWADHMRFRMVDRFQALDEDGDGVVTADEMQAPFRMMFSRHDRDGAVSRDELRPRYKGPRGWWTDDDDDDDDRPRRPK